MNALPSDERVAVTREISRNPVLYQIGVVGGGTMGRGIMQLFLQAGHEVRCHDAAAGAAEKAIEHVRAMLSRGVAKGKITSAAFEAMMGRVAASEHLAGLADCDVVIEAIVEDLDLKIELFRALEERVSPAAILATNTSSLLVSGIAAGCRHPQRVAGLHFFNPVPLMRVTEIIPGIRTEAATVETLRSLIEGAGHRAVIAADQPGFLVNHAGRGLYTEGLRILEERVADALDIDRLLREAAGFRMGPFELMDLTGLDVSGRVMESIYEQFQQEPRFRPSSLVRPRVAAGLFGRKSGRGWYAYEGERKVEAPVRALPPLAREVRVWIDVDAPEHAALAALVRTAGGELCATAAEAELLIVQFWGRDASGYCAAQGLDAERCVALDPLPGLARHRTLMLTAVTTPAARDAAAALFAADGVPVTVIHDSAGFVVQRVLATIINIAADIAQRGIASIADIEAAVTLGLGYPRGPLAWGDAIGPARVLQILQNLHAATGDPRYRASPWLARRAALGRSLLSPEALR
jgi:3-hydroxybutyryl-CoA dehydrogenase